MHILHTFFSLSHYIYTYTYIPEVLTKRIYLTIKSNIIVAAARLLANY